MEESRLAFNKLEDIPASAWKKLGEKKIFFGHQSVGNNIIKGIKDILKDNPNIDFNIMEISEPVELKEGVFAHTNNLGKNEDPQSKITAFANYLENGMGNNTDLAFFTCSKTVSPSIPGILKSKTITSGTLSLSLASAL